MSDLYDPAAHTFDLGNGTAVVFTRNCWPPSPPFSSPLLFWSTKDVRNLRSGGTIAIMRSR